jgi:hypothetical protein
VAGRCAGFASEQLVDRHDELRRQRGAQARQIGGSRWSRASAVSASVSPRNGTRPARHSYKHESERVEIGSPVEFLAAHLLGRQVLRGAHHDVVAGEVGLGRLQPFGDAEVGQQHATVRRHHDVARLHVTVDETRGVCMVERRRHAGADVTGEFGAEPFLGVEDLAQALALDELHDDGLASVLFEHVVDGDDVRMVEARRSDRLAPEALGDHRVGGEGRFEPFDRDFAVEREIDGQPHLGHAALREHALQFVPLRDDGREWEAEAPRT